MIYKTSFPNSPEVGITIYGVPVDYLSIESIEIDVAENCHDMAVITFVGLPPMAITDYLNAPVSIQITASPSRFCSFYGNVYYVEPMIKTRRPTINKSPVQEARVVCFGSSMKMVSEKSRTWDNLTLSKLVETLSSTYGMSYSIPSDHFVWSRMLQHNQSDWSFLVSVCKSLGYYVTCNGTHIHVYDPYKTIARQLPYVELVSLGEEVSYSPGRILEFTGTFGDKSPNSDWVNIEMIGTDDGGRLIKSEKPEVSTGFGEVVNPKFTNVVATEVSSSEMLNRLVEAEYKTTYPFNADVITTGIPEATPGSVARVNRYGSAFDGFWLVRSVQHKVTRGNYVSTLGLSTDSTNQSTVVINPAAAFTEPPGPQLAPDGSWVASSLFEETYA